MKIYNQVRNFFERKATRWYIVVLVLSIIEIANYGFLSLVVPLWVCNIITIGVTIVATCYIEIMYNFLRQKVKVYMASRKEELEKQLNLMEEHIDDLNQKNIELQNEIYKKTTEFISEGLSDAVGEVKECVTDGTKKLGDAIKSSTDSIEVNADQRNSKLIQSMDEQKNQVEDLLKKQKNDLDKQLTEQRDITNESTASIQNDLKENALISASNFEDIISNIGNLNSDVSEKLGRMQDEDNINIEKIAGMFSQQSELSLSNINQNRSEIDKMAEQIREIEKAGKSLLDSTSALIVENIVTSREVNEKMNFQNHENVTAKLQEISQQINEHDGNTEKSVISATDKIIENSNKNGETIKEKVAETLTTATKSIDDTRELINNTSTEIVENIIANREINEKMNSQNHENVTVKLQEIAQQINEHDGNTEKSIVLATDKVIENSNGNRETIDGRISETLATTTKTIEDTSALLHQNIVEVSNEHEQRLSLKILEVGDKVNHGDENTSEKFSQLFTSIEDVKDAGLDNNRIISSLIEEKISLLDNSSSERMDNISNDINQKINEIRSVVHDSKDNVLSEMKLDIQSVIEKLQNMNDESKEDVKQQADMLSNHLKEIEIKTEGLSAYTSEMQAELSKLLVQLLDNTDENLDASKNAYDGIFNQITGFSKETKNHLMILEQRVEEFDKVAEQGRKIAEEANNDRSDEALEINKKFDIIADASQKSQIELAVKLDNIKNQVSNLNMLAEVLKKVSEVQKFAGQGDRTTSDLKPNRIEEINDSETGIKVVNHYKNNKLVLSEMISGKQKNYEVEYDEGGKIIRSKNFDEKGNVTTDLQYHSNGQVKVRTERVTISGKQQTVTSHFDNNGNKIK